MWLSSSLIIYPIFGDHFTLLQSMMLAACVTPTDPILASSIIRRKFAEEHIPENVRDLLSAER
jgi:NhaP-type Na+/H+ or K+/H+ antiporter